MWLANILEQTAEIAFIVEAQKYLKFFPAILPPLFLTAFELKEIIK